VTLVDPTTGVGYAFGEILPSAHMTTIASQQPDALDAINGGTYVQTAAIAVTGDDWSLGAGSDALVLNFATTTTTSSLVMSGDDAVTQKRVDSTTLVDGDIVFADTHDYWLTNAATSAGREYTLADSTRVGACVWLWRRHQSAFDIDIKVDGGTTFACTLDANFESWVKFCNIASAKWRVVAHGANVSAIDLT